MIPVLQDPVLLTKEAADMAQQAMDAEGLTDHGIRVGVIGGGCSGLQYLLDFVKHGEESEDYDFVSEQHGVTVVVDCFSAAHLKGTTIEYQDTLHGSGFKFINPGITRSCGCGSSFS